MAKAKTTTPSTAKANMEKAPEAKLEAAFAPTTPNLFEALGAAPVVAVPAPAKKVKMVFTFALLDAFAAAKSLIDTITGALKVFEAKVKAAAFEYWVDEAVRTASQPDNFTVQGALSSANFQVRRPSSALSQEAVAFLLSKGVKPEEEEISGQKGVIPDAFLMEAEFQAEYSKWASTNPYMVARTKATGTAPIRIEPKVIKHKMGEKTIGELVAVASKGELLTFGPQVMTLALAQVEFLPADPLAAVKVIADNGITFFPTKEKKAK